MDHLEDLEKDEITGPYLKSLVKFLAPTNWTPGKKPMKLYITDDVIKDPSCWKYKVKWIVSNFRNDFENLRHHSHQLVRTYH